MTTGADIPLTTPGDETRELRRPREGRMLAGVSAGLAAYFGLSPAIYRIAFAALALLGGAGILLYVVAALVIPAEGAEQSAAEEFLRRHRDRPAMLVGLGVAGVIAICVISFPGDWGWPHAGPLGFLLLLGVAGMALWQVSQRDSGAVPAAAAAAAAPVPRRPSLFLPGLGVLLALAGLAALLDLWDVVDLRLDVLLAAGAIVAGLLIAVGALLQRMRGLVLLGFLLALGVAGAGVAAVGADGPIGDRTYAPVSAAELRDEYKVGIGDLKLDLRSLELPPGVTRVEAKLGIGELDVLVPAGVAVAVTADADAGEVTVLGRRDDGWQPEERVVEEGARLVIDAEVGFGDLEVRRVRIDP